MHIYRYLLDAMERGEAPEDFILEIMIEHLAAICPVCGEALADFGAALDLESEADSTGPQDPLKRVLRRLERHRRLRAEANGARRGLREVGRIEPTGS